MRDRVDPSALPRAPTPTGGDVTGLRVARDEVRCPYCDKKLGDRLAGTYETTCPRCKKPVSITR